MEKNKIIEAHLKQQDELKELDNLVDNSGIEDLEKLN